MVTLEAVHAAVFAADPYAEMDRLVRAEQAAGRTVREVYDALNTLLNTVLDFPGLTADGEEAMLGTLDALHGDCHPDYCYSDPPAGRPGFPAGEPAPQPRPADIS